MNFYVVVEGKVEKDVYLKWIPFVNSKLRYVNRIEDVTDNCFYLITGGGYPQYFEVINDAITDVNESRTFRRLIISVDSEDLTFKEKYTEVEEFLTGKTILSDVKIIIQHFCIETWGLANRKVIRPHPHSDKLREFVRFFHVRVRDPELLPPYPKDGLNRSQFAEKYLRLAINDKFRNLTYTKRAPYAILHPSYFAEVKNRFLTTHHIPSFEAFLSAFIE